MKDLPCYKCGTTKNIKPVGGVNQTSNICNLCRRIQKKIYYDKCRVTVFEHYGDECACCGEDIEAFLSIDHINNDGHLEVWPSGRRISGRQLYQKIIKNDFPSTYQLLCMNCNFGKRMNNGFCPHSV